MRTALVTGANSGIGFAVVTKLLAEGHKVIAHIRENLGDLEEIRDVSHLEIIRGDFSDIESVSQMASDPKVQAVDILVNNAGTYCFREDFESIAVKEVEHLLRVNVIAPMVLCQTVIPTMIERGWGRIVNISSVSVSHGGAARTIDYTFSKSALESMTWTLSKSLAPKNVLINAIRVGVTDTKLHQLNSTKNLEDRIRTIPLGRMADPGEIAETIFFLCSDRASFISGTVLEATGGEK
jgi:NAD(P)-dependent dehydrogenase (short-subunit alcohol dehydrogenase family)|tara:strand:+ start:850 stop:1563 length:714 start_codon:yes stop_codon:yes gene_type:complete